MGKRQASKAGTPHRRPGDAGDADREARRAFFDRIAGQSLKPGPFRRYYGRRLARMIRTHVPAGSSVIEIGCGMGDLLAALEPRRGLGVDFSPRMVALARERHPGLEFIEADAERLPVDERFDFVVISNLVGELVDIQRALQNVRRLCHPRTRIIIADFNYLWRPLVKLAERIGQKPPQREQNWLELVDLENLLALVDLDPIRHERGVICPVWIPLAADLVNDYLATLPGLSRIAANQLVVARSPGAAKRREYKVSVIVPCKDEAGNIEPLIRAVPRMGLGTEVIFVDGRSVDGTVEEIRRCIDSLETLNPDLDRARLMVQPGKGKGDAVRTGFEAAAGEVLMILDADITVRPEELPKFYDALVDGRGELINGSRLVYPMEDEAMRFLNMLGNHFFSWVFTWLLGQRLTDTLCGTKVLFKKDYEAIERGRAFFGDFDPFGDFDLLFGAAKQNLKIREIPIRYRRRDFGEIKIDRFRHGLLLLRMSAVGFKRFKLGTGV